MSSTGRGLPTIGTDGLEWHGFPVPALTRGRVPTVLVPSEQVLLVIVDLPVASQRQRISALPFAMEGKLAEPISGVHVALGAQVAPKRFLAAAVRRETMAGWVRQIAKTSRAGARLLPDALTVPRPDGEGWTIWTRGPRTLVRRGDGSGFAVASASLDAAWHAAGKPFVTAYGDALHAGIGREPEAKIPPRKPDPLAMAFDLRQGDYAVGGGQETDRWLKVVSFVLIAGAAAHGAVAAADTAALHKIADEKRAEAARLLDGVSPGASARGDVAGQLARLLPRENVRKPGRFLPLFARASAALGPFSQGVSIKTLSYSDEDATLNMTIEASDLAALQRIEAALRDADLGPVVGAATTGNGAAEARISLRDPEGA